MRATVVARPPTLSQAYRGAIWPPLGGTGVVTGGATSVAGTVMAVGGGGVEVVVDEAVAPGPRPATVVVESAAGLGGGGLAGGPAGAVVAGRVVAGAGGRV